MLGVSKISFVFGGLGLIIWYRKIKTEKNKQLAGWPLGVVMGFRRLRTYLSCLISRITHELT